MDMKLETKRLIIRAFNLQDASFILELFNTKSWLKNIGDRGVHSLEDAEQYLKNRIIASYQEHGFGMYAMTEKTSQTTIGMCGIVKRAGLEQPDFGFALLPEYMRKGYTYEAAKGILAYATEHLTIKQLYAITLPQNTASNELLKKLNFVYQKDIKLPNDGEILYLYNLSLV